jgi:hypothetical protein
MPSAMAISPDHRPVTGRAPPRAPADHHPVAAHNEVAVSESLNSHWVAFFQGKRETRLPMRNLLFNVSIAVTMVTMFVVMLWASLRFVLGNNIAGVLP